MKSLDNIREFPVPKPLEARQEEIVASCIQGVDLIFLGEAHGSLEKPGEGISPPLAEKLIELAAKAHDPIKFIGIEAYFHPSVVPDLRYLPRGLQHLIPYIEKRQEDGIKVRYIDASPGETSISGREETITENITNAHEEIGRGLIIMGLDHVQPDRELLYELSPDLEQKPTETVVKRIRGTAPKLKTASLVCKVHPLARLHGEFDPLQPTIIQSADLKLIELDRGGGEKEFLKDGAVDLAILYPFQSFCEEENNV